MVEVSGQHSVGMRENQEDAFDIVSQSEVDPTGDLLLIVSDGMGGHVGGEIASNLGVATFKHHFISGSDRPKIRDRLLSAMHAANNAIADRIAKDAAVKGMGCTMIGAIKNGDKLTWVSVGDSHIYLLRDSKLRKLNADHSVYGELLELVAAGKITQQDADNHPRKNALRSALIGGGLPLIDVDAVPLKHGDVVVVATDGLDTVGPKKLESLLAQLAQSDARTIATELLTAVADIGYKNQDNTTIVAYRHRESGRSALSPDSKWGMPAPSKAGPSGVTKYSYLIAGLSGLAALAILIAVLAFKPAKNTPQEPVAAITQTAPPALNQPRETNIGGQGADPAINSRQNGDDDVRRSPVEEGEDASTEVEPDTGTVQEQIPRPTLRPDTSIVAPAIEPRLGDPALEEGAPAREQE